MIKIKHINEDDYARIFVFGDMHGCLRLFNLMIKKINLTKKDLVIILGDSCDRGEDTIGLYKRYAELIRNGYALIHVLGNHEKMMMDGYFGGDTLDHQNWLRNGGDKTKKSIYKQNLNSFALSWLKDFIGDMPHIVSSEKSIFVHAAFDGAKSEEEQDEDYVLWCIEPFWGSNKTGKRIFHGRVASEENRITRRANNVFSMDVGAVFFKRLVIMEIKSGEKFEADLREQK
ncbi:metallophosphoesterase [Campylobacter showae]|uniref:metallophosphoesterase n=1 Tax=Campylobacter showae TaxID=204 RepID=UPI0028D02B38|nr:metallophosphoesterase [Campylobacter showae]